MVFGRDPGRLHCHRNGISNRTFVVHAEEAMPIVKLQGVGVEDPEAQMDLVLLRSPALDDRELVSPRAFLVLLKARGVPSILNAGLGEERAVALTWMWEHDGFRC